MRRHWSSVIAAAALATGHTVARRVASVRPRSVRARRAADVASGFRHGGQAADRSHPGRRIGSEVVAGAESAGRRRGPCGRGLRIHRIRLGCAAVIWPPPRCCPTACSPRSPPTTPSCWGLSVTHGCRRGAGTRSAVATALRTRPLPQPAAGEAVPGVSTPLAGRGPADIDMVVCREGTEGPYVGAGGRLRAATSQEVAVEESLNTAFGVERIVRDAFARAQRRRGRVTLVHKTNVLTNAGSLWTRVFGEVAAEFPDVVTDYVHVDAASMFFITDPGRFDVVVTDNPSATSSPTSARRSPVASDARRRATSTPRAPIHRCSSRCTVPLRTSPVRRRRTRRRPSSAWR